jgi:hypothetical protein
MDPSNSTPEGAQISFPLQVMAFAYFDAQRTQQDTRSQRAIRPRESPQGDVRLRL